ncbi:MAG: hypothetical protein IKK93_08855, partial [Campylobacter sp.]|nr:hypothetical protein [Campylobacter sp.]MBR6612325.1 hypothetical protein [Campylobacter sp.]
MNKFTRYGIQIAPLKLKDIEILRKWRNDPKISSLMLSQNGEYITKEQQLKWYDSIKDKTDALYYMAFVDEIAVGYFCFQQIANKCAVPGEILVIPSQMDQARITFGAY